MPYHHSLSLVALAVATGFSSHIAAANLNADEMMVVSSSRMEQKLADVASPVSVITAKQIEEQLVTNMADLFRYEPGVTTLGGQGDPQTFIIRGMGENRVKIVRDGVRQNDAYRNGGVGQSYFDTDMIKQVEIAKGPASAAYGSDALGGVIAITTKDASDFLKGQDHYLDVTSGYTSSSHQKMAGFTGALRTGELENLLRYTWRDGGVTQNHDSSKNDFDIGTHALLFKSKWLLSDTQSLKLTVDYLTNGEEPDLIKLNRVGTGAAQVFEQPITDQQTDNLSLVLDHSLALNHRWVDRIDNKVYYTRTKQTLDQYASSKYPIRPSNPFLTKNSLDNNVFDQTSLGAQLQFHKAVSNHRLAWGGEYEHTNNERTRFKGPATPGDFIGYNELSFPTTTSERSAIWLFDEISLSERWVLTPGARYDYYRMIPDDEPAYQGDQLRTVSQGELSPKFAVVFKANEAAHLFAQYSHGFKAPMYDNAFSTLNHQAYGYRIDPNPNLSPESSDGIDVGVRGSSNGASYEIASFYNSFDDFIEMVEVAREGRTVVYQYQNLNKATTKGVEVKADYWLNDNLNIWGNLAYLTGKDGDGNYLNSLSPLNGTLGVRLDQDTWNLNTALRVTDNMDKVRKDEKGNDYVKSAGWGVIDVYAQFVPIADLQLNLGVFNLFDKEYIRYEQIAGRSVGSDNRAMAEPGRNLSARIKYRF